MKIAQSLSGLALIRDQKFKFFLALSFSVLILALDLVLVLSIPQIIEALTSMDFSNPFEKIEPIILLLVALIIFRPLIGWVINFLQIQCVLRIQRNLEEMFIDKLQARFLTKNDSFGDGHAANVIITHGRYFLDNFLLPLIRAITDFGSIMTIFIGLLIQFFIPVTSFIITLGLMLFIYQRLSRGMLRRHGEVIIRSSEKIMYSARDGFFDTIEGDAQAAESGPTRKKITEILNDKLHSNVRIGAISQGVKYIIEFCFLVAFSVSFLIVFLTDSMKATIFISTLAYSAMRILPAINAVMAFFQAQSGAHKAIEELQQIQSEEIG